MGKTKDLGHLAHIVAYNSENHITVPAGITMHTNQLVASQAWVTTALGSYALSSSLGSYVPTSRTITINGTTYDLSENRSWDITSMIYPAAGIPLSTGSAWGTSITNNSANWNTAYGWGNHASAGYLTSISSLDVVTALGYAPYNGTTNPAGYITGITSSNVTTALGYTPVTNARTITINGTSYDLTANRSWTVTATETDTLATVMARGASTASGITFTAPGGTVLLKHAVSEVDAWIFQENAANWGLYWKNAPTGNHTFGGYTSVGAELFGMSAANASGNGVLTSNFVGATGAYAQWMLSNYTGYIWSASTIYAQTSMIVGGNIVLHAGNYTSYRGTQLISPNGGTVVAADSAMPDAGHSFIHTLALGPSGNDGHILGMTWAGTTTVYGAQIWVDTDPTNTMAFRSRSSAGTWTGWNTIIHSGNIGSQSVSYASSAGNSDTVDGYHVSTGGTANTIPTRNASGYLSPENWIQVNGHYGLYSGTNNAHFYPNNLSYGSWRIEGSRNGWTGLHFGGGNGITLMMNEGEFGFHREGIGWVGRFTSGRYYGNSDYAYSAGNSDTIDGYHLDQGVSTGNSPSFNTLYTSWFRAYGTTGLYQQDYGGHFARSTDGSYGTWQTWGAARSGYAGLNIIDPSGFWNNHMFENGNGGLYQENGGGWGWYYHRGNDSFAAAGSSTSSSYRFVSNGSANIQGDLAINAYTGFGGSTEWGNGTTQYHGSNTGYNWRDWGGWGGYWWSRNGGDMIMNLYALYSVTGSISDIRYKKDVEALPYGLNEIMQLNPIKYHYNLPKESMLSNDPDYFLGFSAQEVQALIPEAVHEKVNEDVESLKGMLAITYDELIPVTVQAIKEQQVMIHNQNIRIQKLEALVTQLLNN